MTDKEVNSIEEFLKTLDGRKTNVTIPNLPASTSKTPKPDIN